MTDKPAAKEPARRARGRNPRHRDWTEFDRRFVEGFDGEHGPEWLSVSETAVRLGIPDGSARKHAAGSGLVAERDVFRARMVTERQDDTIRQRVAAATDADVKALTYARCLLHLVGSRIDKLVREEAENRAGGQGPGVFSAGPKTLQALVDVLAKSHAVALRAAGDTGRTPDEDAAERARQILEERGLVRLFENIRAYTEGYQDAKTAPVVVEATAREVEKPA